MKAVISRTGYIDDLRIEEMSTPAVPDGGLLIRVRASSINIADLFAISGIGRTVSRWVSRSRSTPSVPGTDFAGIVEAEGHH